ncbi:hypothetical protein [Rhodoferax mekongensis]|uniref:Uncharacterized protein n=1 Tax=Rhodoferax mekongensis TaxID=3068341 RepID=A0ABZ0AWL3_9BURK|nr:hypothetical protein [Rhodoferax sp. TBRC 17307]WNO04001.1 hypothetical protein RAN89_13925 [Rhodoferax sp. TBRC 17307]
MSVPEDGQNWQHRDAYNAFLALDRGARYATLSIPHTESGHVPDEVVLTVSLEAEQGKWPDKNKYVQALVGRCYRHIRAHVSRNSELQKRGGGIDAVTDDAVGFVLQKILFNGSDQAYAKNLFGSLLRKRFLDFVDSNYSSYNKSKAEASDEDLELALNSEIDSETFGQVGYVESLTERLKVETKEDNDFERIRSLLSDPDFLNESENFAFTLHWIAGIQIRSKNEEAVTVCKLMNRSDKQVRLYITSAIIKLRKKLK